MRHGSRAVAAVLAFAWAVPVVAQQASNDAYYRVPARELKITEGQFPTGTAETGWRSWRHWQRREAMTPYVVLEGAGEAYLEMGEDWSPQRPPGQWREATAVAIRAAKGQEVTGRLFVPKPDYGGLVALKFVVPASAASADARPRFYHAKEQHYQRLLARGVAGAAWFRHQARQAVPTADTPGTRPPGARGPEPEDELTRTYALFTGGRAVSENLQLDRVLPETTADEPTVDVDSLTGITVQEIDWQPLIKGLKPARDPLASLIPADQHAVFFPSFEAFVAVADELDRQGTPVLRAVDPRSESARTRERYEQQLGLSLSGLAPLVGPQVIKSVALTGSDPYYRTGTDVAVLFESSRPEALEGLLAAQVALAAKGNAHQAKVVKGQAAGVAYSGFRSPDRSTCSYVAAVKGTLVVTNSLAQLERLAQVSAGGLPALGALEEYTFFRNRYSRSDEEESALLFVSDATRTCLAGKASE